MIRQLAAGAILLAVSQLAHASTNQLDDQGCHTDPVTKKYHCHNSAIEHVGSGGVIVVDTTRTDDPKDDDVYKDCTEVRDDGRAPLKLGDIGYSAKLDPDKDGIACD